MLFIKTKRDMLLAPLQSVSGIVEKKHTLPILSNVLLEKKADIVTCVATDIEIQITTSTSGTSDDGDCAVTVGARKLQDILRSLPDGTDVSLNLEDKRLLVRAGKSRFTLQTLPAEEFPHMALSDGVVNKLSVTQKQFRKLLSQTQFSMAAQDVRYYLNGLLLIVDGKELRAVATDGHRLAYASMPLDESHESSSSRQEVILPRKTVVELARQLADSDDALEVTIVGNQIVFRFGHIELISKLIDGKFPDYERVIPQGHPKLVKASRLALRVEGGAVLARADADIPVTQLFLTGGDTTVRGYGYRAIGARTENNLLYGGRYLGLASVEWQRPIVLAGNRKDWEHTVFLDAGSVTDEPGNNVQIFVGAGSGIRWNSPVGPLQADIAYGFKTQQLRLHLRLGFTF